MITRNDISKGLRTAQDAAQNVGKVLRRNLQLPKEINSSEQHDIKLELDVRCQKMIEKVLLRAFPGIAILGEEGITGDPEADARWVVDPIDGTVNFTYGIPHACVSIALQSRKKDGTYQTDLGIVYDPFVNEMFTATRTSPAKLNGKAISVSDRSRLDEAIVSIGFAKSTTSLNMMLPEFNYLVHRVRKIRIMGAAALALVYVAAGRFDAYVEGGVRLWDIAAGGLILERAGGDFFNEPSGKDYRYSIIANNGKLRKKLSGAGSRG